MNFGDFWDRISTPGDVGAALLGFSGGFIVDLTLLPIGVPPGTVGLVGASTALGAKKSAEAMWNERQERKQGKQRASAEQQPEPTREHLRTVAGKMKRLATKAEMDQLTRRIEKQLHLWEIGIRTDEQFKAALEALADQYAEASPEDSP